MPTVIDVSRGDKKLVEHLKPGVKKVLLAWCHGIGDSVMAMSVLQALRKQYPDIHFDLGIFKGLDIEILYPDAIFFDGDWREHYENSTEYDVVFSWNFPLERADDLSKTKAEISCIEELGIAPVCGHLPLKTKPLIALHFQQTSIPWVANATPEVAKRIWDDVLEAGCIPIECHFQHVFHNPENAKFDFVDTHMRACTPHLETLMALLGSVWAFVGVVSGNFHLAHSILPHHRVMLLEKDLRSEQFTKVPIATADLKNYNGEVKDWLLSITKHR